MRVSPFYTLDYIEGRPFLLPFGQNIAEYRKSIALNDLGVLLWQSLGQADSVAELVETAARHLKIEKTNGPPFKMMSLNLSGNCRGKALCCLYHRNHLFSAVFRLPASCSPGTAPDNWSILICSPFAVPAIQQHLPISTSFSPQTGLPSTRILRKHFWYSQISGFRRQKQITCFAAPDISFPNARLPITVPGEPYILQLIHHCPTFRKHFSIPFAIYF